MTGAAARRDGRAPDQLRPVKIELGVNVHAEGSCLIEMGRTRVWITASVEDRVPMHRRGSGQGWIRAEYSMLPRAPHDREAREAIQGIAVGSTLGLAFKGIKELIVAQKRALTTLA